jgi:hypothetical protein
MPLPQDTPPDAPGYAYGPLSNTVRPPPVTQGQAAPAPPSLLDRVMGLFSPAPSPVPALLNRTAELEKQNDALQFRSTQIPNGR